MMDSDRSDGQPKRRGFLVEAAVFAVCGIAGAIAYFGWLREPRPPNVILISIDTLRPDHLRCYGYDKPTSPSIDAIADRGARFEQVHSTSSWTLPSHLALMSGLPDQLHGVVHDTLALPEDTTMLAEVLREHGYRTGGFFGGPYLDPVFGFDQGFELYDNCGVVMYSKPAQVVGAAAQMMDRANERKSHKEPTAEKTHAKAVQFLERHQNEPFFLFIHHWDVHYDFTAPRQFLDKFARPGPRTLPYPPDFPPNPQIHPEMSPADYEFLLACYDAEIAWVDHHVGKLMDKLDELGLTDDTYVIVTADHGEEFFEHGNKGHRQNLYDESLRIPLIVAGPGIRKGLRIPGQARIFDVMPTILELCDLPRVPAVFGYSLVPWLDGERPVEMEHLPIVAELTNRPIIADPNDPTKWTRADYTLRYDATSGGNHKLIRMQKDVPAGALAETHFELFDLANDPREERDLTASEPALFHRLEAAQARYIEALITAKRARAQNANRPLPPGLLEGLDDMGY